MASTSQPLAATASTPGAPVSPDSAAPSALETHEMMDLPETTTQPDVSPIEPETARPAAVQRSETADIFLGPAGAEPSSSAVDSTDPILRITLMLITGARHPYTISNRYLTSRKVTAVNEEGKFDPREMSTYKLKELIWTDWRPEWEPKPRDPAAIRLIIMGRLLEDKNQLKVAPFSLENNNIIHMTVKPADLMDDETEGAGKQAVKSGRGRANDSSEDAGCCRCVVQ